MSDFKTEATRYGFTFGSAHVERVCHDEVKGWSVISIFSKNKHVDITVMKGGKIVISEIYKDKAVRE